MADLKQLQRQAKLYKAKHLLAGAALLFSMAVNGPARATLQSYRAPTKKEASAKKSTDKKSVPQQTNYDEIKLNKIDDMYKLFDMSLNLIFAELILEEVPMTNAYDDHGLYAGKKNTYGVGSTYSPLNINDYNNPNAKWYHLAGNPKTFASRKVSHQDMLKLVIGWAKYMRVVQNPKTKKFVTNEKTILERMFDELRGASLRPNEFSALFCAAYNNPNNIKKLCPYVKENHKDKIACANKIMTWCTTGAANAGTKSRCVFESLVYLNVDDFCDDMLDLYTKPSVSTGCSCINVRGVRQQTLTKANYKQYSDNACQKFQSVVYKGGVRTGDACANAKWKYKNPLHQKKKQKDTLQQQYDQATKIYAKGEYEKALQLFLDLEKRGASGADLYNDIAICCYNLKQYNQCLLYCRKALQTAECGEFAKACFNAGLAYEAQHNYGKAITNYDAALKYYNKYGISNQSSTVDYPKVYKNAKTRATNAQKASSAKTSATTEKMKSAQSRVSAKSTASRAAEHTATTRRGARRTR